MALPNQLPQARLLITVKTYPRPTPTYEEVVCTAGLLSDGEWVRIYPVLFKDIPYQEQYSKFNWIQLDLVKNTSDFRPESYRPRLGIDETIQKIGDIPPGRDWAERKSQVLKEVFTSLNDLIILAKDKNSRKSLATLKPHKIIDFEIKEEEERDWNPSLLNHLLQMRLFEPHTKTRQVVRKLPYRYYYHFLTDGDSKPHELMIQDWEIGALYWNCLKQTEGDEIAANQLVRQKYFDEFVSTKDLYFFLGTTYRNHLRAPNPFSIIGVFYPPKTLQPSLL